MGDAVVITAIVVSGVLGPAAGAALSRAQYRLARRSEREDELLHVLDDVTLYVNRGRRALETSAECAQEGIHPDDTEARAAWESYSEVLPPMRAAFQRVFVRLGRTGGIPEAIEEVRSGFFALRAPIDDYREGENWSEQLEARYRDARADFLTKQDHLYEAVFSRVGLPPDPESSRARDQTKTRLKGTVAR